MREWVFGYASLVHDYAGGDSVLCSLGGHRRVWGVAADNSRVLPGYKVYLSRRDGSRPAVYVAFVDIAPDPDTVVEGVALPVDQAALGALDLRERNYDRTDVTDLVEGVEGRVWTYVGSQDGRRRLQRGRAAGTAVVSRDYVDKVHEGFKRLGGDHYDRFLGSSSLADLPAWDLERLDPADCRPEVA